MKNLITTAIAILFSVAVWAKPHCQGFDNYDDKVTIVLTDDNVDHIHTVTDVKFIPTWKGKEYPATSVETTVQDGVATITLVFPHITQFSNPKVILRINGKNTKIAVCQ